MTFQLVLKDMNHVKGDIESLAEHCFHVTILVTQTEQMHEFKNMNGNIGIHFVIRTGMTRNRSASSIKLFLNIKLVL